MKNFFFKGKQTKYLSQAIQLEELVNTPLISATMGVVSLAILAFVVWASFTNINEIARTPGEVVTEGAQQVVQHLEGGIIKEIMVSEGDTVEAGQTLIVLDGVGIQEDFERVLNRDLSLRLQEERLRAFIENREPKWNFDKKIDAKLIEDQKSSFLSMLKSRAEEREIIKEQIAQKQNTIQMLQSDLSTTKGSQAIIQDLYDRRTNLNSKGYASDFQLLETKQKLNAVNGEISQTNNRIATAQAEIREFKNRLNSLNASHADKAHERLDNVLAELGENTELLQKLKNRTNRLEVKSPTRGFVKGLTINTVGAVVQPGATLMEIVPLDEKLIVEIKIPPQHIGHLKNGQNVQVKFSSYDFSRYGSITGHLNQISASTFNGERGERYYQGRVLLDKAYVGHNELNKVLPGMTVMADIVTGEKTIMDYLLKPIHVSLQSSFTER